MDKKLIQSLIKTKLKNNLTDYYSSFINWNFDSKDPLFFMRQLKGGLNFDAAQDLKSVNNIDATQELINIYANNAEAEIIDLILEQILYRDCYNTVEMNFNDLSGESIGSKVTSLYSFLLRCHDIIAPHATKVGTQYH